MAASTITFDDKILHEDKPEIPANEKLTFTEVNAFKAAANNHASLLDGLETSKAPTATLTSHLADVANPHAVTKAQVGLSNVNNTSDVDKPVSTAQATAITTAINNLINAAPGALDTLDELAQALGDDPNFATTVTNALASLNATKADKVPSPTTYTDNATIALVDTFIIANKATSMTLTIPLNSVVAFPLNKYIPVMQLGAGTVTFAPVSGGVSIVSSSGDLTTPGQNSLVGLIQTATNVWKLINGNSGAIVDWSAGSNPVGWTSFSIKKCFYVDNGKTITMTGEFAGVGDGGGTAVFTLPVAASSAVYTGTAAAMFLAEAINNATGAVGKIYIPPGSTTAQLFKDITGAAAWTASVNRQVRFTLTYFK